MTEYLLTVVTVALVSSLALALSHSSMRSSVRGALGLILLLTMLSPMVKFVLGLSELELPELDLSQTEGKDSCTEITEAAFCEGIADALVDEWGDSLEGVRVYSRGFDRSDMLADSVTVCLPVDAAGVDYRLIREYIAKNFTRGGVCEVLYG